MNVTLRAIPSVERVLQALGPSDLPRAVVTATVRRTLAALRADAKIAAPPPEFDSILGQVHAALATLRATRLQPVINGTGVIVHTNLGRAPLPAAALAAVASLGGDYNTLEYDLAAGERSASRAGYLENNLALLCGAQAATVVNNCAAALVLMLRHFVRRPERKEVIISRGELVQIGGGFRVPEILETAGAVLREVGTTNRTTVEDYERAITPQTALLLRVHRSNFYLGGFEETPDPATLAALARRRRVPFAEDLGSGAVVATERLAAIEHERTPAEAIDAGADAVCFSGDKLFGGPQAGIIVGRVRWVAGFKKEPFFRALRCDKLVLGALQATTDLYLAGTHEAEIPALAMMRVPLDTLRARAEAIFAALPAGSARIGTAHAKVGGGTLPRAELPSVTLDFRPPPGVTLGEFAARLRAGTPPVMGYVARDRFRLDLRTIFPRQDEALVDALRTAWIG